MRRNLRRWLPVLIMGLVLLNTAACMPYTLRGSEIQQPYAAPDFTLPNGGGGEYALADQRGQIVLIFFGYTSCPDVCPTTLSDMRQVSQRLGDDASKVDFVFVTVDPERDVPEKISKYVTAFDPAFIGLTGSAEQLDPVWRAYGVYHQANKESPDDQYYEVEHSSRVYLIDTSGNLRLTYSFGTAVDDILQDVRYLLKQEG